MKPLPHNQALGHKSSTQSVVLAKDASRSKPEKKGASKGHPPKGERFITLTLMVHSPVFLTPYSFFDIGSGKPYFNMALTYSQFTESIQKKLLPLIQLLLKHFQRSTRTHVAFSLSGQVLGFLEKMDIGLLDGLRQLANTGRVEFLGDTHCHSLASLMGQHEFQVQVLSYNDHINRLLGQKPSLYMNTGQYYTDTLGHVASQAGFQGIYNHETTLSGHPNPHHLYHHPLHKKMKVYMEDRRLSEMLLWGISQNKHIFSPKDFVQQIGLLPSGDDLINLSLDVRAAATYTRFLPFLDELLKMFEQNPGFELGLPSQTLQPKKVLSIPDIHTEKGLSPWLENDLQADMFLTLKKTGTKIKRINNPVLLNTWQLLQESDHFKALSHPKETIKGQPDTESPYERYFCFSNILTDLMLQVDNLSKKPSNKIRPMKNKTDLHST